MEAARILHLRMRALLLGGCRGGGHSGGGDVSRCPTAHAASAERTLAMDQGVWWLRHIFLYPAIPAAGVPAAAPDAARAQQHMGSRSGRDLVCNCALAQSDSHAGN